MKYWYFITEYYCPLCNSSRVFKARCYYPKPKAWKERHKIIEAWDNCGI